VYRMHHSVMMRLHWSEMSCEPASIGEAPGAEPAVGGLGEPVEPLGEDPSREPPSAATAPARPPQDGALIATRPKNVTATSAEKLEQRANPGCMLSGLILPRGAFCARPPAGRAIEARHAGGVRLVFGVGVPVDGRTAARAKVRARAAFVNADAIRVSRARLVVVGCPDRSVDSVGTGLRHVARANVIDAAVDAPEGQTKKAIMRARAWSNRFAFVGSIWVAGVASTRLEGCDEGSCGGVMDRHRACWPRTAG
jgi:hypothetical protein